MLLHPLVITSCYHNKTAKSRKKAERKKHSLKESSAHEDIALMEALKEITESTNNIQGNCTCSVIVVHVCHMACL